MFTSLALTALNSHRHNQYSPLPTIAACALVSATAFGIMHFIPCLVVIVLSILASLMIGFVVAIGAILWAMITDGQRTRERLARETLERLGSVEVGIQRIHSLLVTVAASEDADFDSQVERELGVLFGGEGTYEDIVILRDATPASEDYEVTEDTWTSVLPGYRGQWAAQELADYSNDDRASGDRVATYCEGYAEVQATAATVVESRREEWRNIMVRVQREMDLIMIERVSALAPIISEVCPLDAMADDGCPNHSCSWESGELLSWTPTMNYSVGTTTRCDRPCLAVAAKSPVVPVAAEEVTPEVHPLRELVEAFRECQAYEAGRTIASEIGGWTNDELATHLRANGVKSARKNWTKGKLVAAYLALRAK